MEGDTNREREEDENYAERHREREKMFFFLLAREKQLYYITASGLGSSHAFKEEAHVPLHLKSHGTVGEDEDEVEACEQRQREQREYSGENMLKNIAVLAR